MRTLILISRKSPRSKRIQALIRRVQQSLELELSAGSLAPSVLSPAMCLVSLRFVFTSSQCGPSGHTLGQILGPRAS
eukprot:6443719-Amphidinium_carterae.1